MAQAPALQKGIGVELVLTSNAAPEPEADEEDALIVTVTAKAGVYFGTNAVTTRELTERLKTRLSDRQQAVYIKADARTHYVNVENVLNAVRRAGVEAPILLTARRESAETETVLPPQGLQVRLGARPLAAPQPAEVQLLDAATITLRVNYDDVTWDELQNKLDDFLQHQSPRVILIRADGLEPFAHVVRVVDVGRALDATVVLVTPDL